MEKKKWNKFWCSIIINDVLFQIVVTLKNVRFIRVDYFFFNSQNNAYFCCLEEKIFFYIHTK